MGNLEGKRWRTGRYSGSGIMLILLYQLSPSSAISPSFYTITMPPHLGSIIHSGATREESRDNSALHSRWQHLGLRQGVCIAEARPPPKTHHEDFPPRDLFRRLPEGWRAPIINAWASLLAGLVAYTIATPIEAFKVGMQTWPASTFQSIGQKILKSRGPLGFFNALDAMLWAGIPYSVIMYGCYQPVKKFVNEKMREAGIEPGAIGQFLGAAVAETLGEIVFVPGELVRIRMMSEPGRYSSFLQAVPAIIKAEGVQSMFRGFFTTLARDIPYTALTFVLFERLRHEMAARSPDGTVSFLQSMFAGIVTAMICSTCTIPLDTLKSKVMTSAIGSTTTIARDMFLQGGVPAFFRGYVPFMAINAASWSSSLAVYATALEYYGGGSMHGEDIRMDHATHPAGARNQY